MFLLSDLMNSKHGLDYTPSASDFGLTRIQIEPLLISQFRLGLTTKAQLRKPTET